MMASKIPPAQKSMLAYLGNKCTHTFYIMPILEEEIVDVLSNFPSGKAAGADDILPDVIKAARFVLAEPLSFIFNMSIILKEYFRMI